MCVCKVYINVPEIPLKRQFGLYMSDVNRLGEIPLCGMGKKKKKANLPSFSDLTSLRNILEIPHVHIGQHCLLSCQVGPISCWTWVAMFRSDNPFVQPSD